MTSVYSQARTDGRQVNQLRPPSITFGLLTRSDGSCQFGLGDSIAISAVTGPVEAKTAFSSYKGMYFDVCIRPATGMAGGKERVLERRVSSLLSACVDASAYPYTQLNVSIEVLSDDGSAESVVLNSAVLAVMNAGLRMTSVPISVNLAGPFLDPDVTEERLHGSTCVSVCMQSGKVVQANGGMGFEGMTMAQATAEMLSGIIRTATAADFQPVLNRVL